MIRCRICLENKRNLRSIFDTDQGLSYASMITLITGIKVVKEHNDVLCLLCCRKLNDFYEFKLLIERSDVELNKQSKIFKFNTINDIKVEFPSELIYKDPGNGAPDYNTLFQNENDCIYYNNTLIKRFFEDEKKNLPIEFRNAIKAEEFQENVYDEQDATIDSNYNYKENMKTSKITEMDKTLNNVIQPHDVNNICIKPILLKDIRVLKTKTQFDFKKRKRKCVFRTKDTLCQFCGKISKNIKSHIKTHIAKGEKKFKCHMCAKSFYTTAQWQYHLKSHSAIKETFKCDHCILVFSAKAEVARHMTVHMEHKKFSCTVCQKEYKWKSGLHRHMLIHNMTGRSIKCDVCDMLFYSQGHLKAHYRVHTGERPYKCELCSQPYSYKRDFNRHCLKKHGVLIDRRPVTVMNDEVLKREKALMRDLMLHLHGLPTETEPMDSFHGPQKALAYAKAVNVMQNGQISIDVHL
ncbi:zinc finger protein 570-like isoform X1 [Pararge aegeria]|nr:zinc finger protein 570-like isoform X1 [Pararge aegeria]